MKEAGIAPMPTRYMIYFIFYQKTPNGDRVWLALFHDDADWGWQMPSFNSTDQPPGADKLLEIMQDRASDFNAKVVGSSLKLQKTTSILSKNGAPDIPVFIYTVEVTRRDTETVKTDHQTFTAFSPANTLQVELSSLFKAEIVRMYNLLEGDE